MRPSSRVLKTTSRQQSSVALLPMKQFEGFAGGEGQDAKDRASSPASNRQKSPPPARAEKKHYSGKNRRAQGVGGDLAEIERSAYERGFAAGEEAGHLLGIKKSEQYRQSLTLASEKQRKTLVATIEQVSKLKTRLLQEAEEDMLSISLAIVRRIIGDETEARPQTVLAHIEKAIKKIGHSEKMIVRLNPLDLETLSAEDDALSHLLKDECALRFEADARLSSGECIVEGTERMVDGRFESQIALFTEALKEQVH